MENNIITTAKQQFDLSPQNFDQALTFSKYLAQSDMVPKDFKGKPENCLIAMQWGYELGMKPLQAIQNIAVINGRPALWGDSVIAIVRGSPLCEYVAESDDGTTATCRVKRRGEPEQVRTFSMEDAKAAGLSGKQGPWSQYPKRMRQMRARAFALRDVFPDVLRGMPVAEEVMDTPTEKYMGPAEVVTPTGPAAYSDEEFQQHLPKWRAIIQNGRKTADQMIAFIGSKRPLTEQQQAALRAVKQPTAVPEAATHEDAPAMSYAEVADRLCKAANTDELATAGSMISLVQDEQQRQELVAMYDQCANAL